MHLKYHCDFCPEMLGGGSSDPDKILDHEPTCEYNPATKCCATCVHQEHTPEYRGRKRPWKCAVFGDRNYRRGCEKHFAKV